MKRIGLHTKWLNVHQLLKMALDIFLSFVFKLQNSINILRIISRNIPNEGIFENIEDELQSKIKFRCIRY